MSRLGMGLSLVAAAVAAALLVAVGVASARFPHHARRKKIENILAVSPPWSGPLLGHVETVEQRHLRGRRVEPSRGAGPEHVTEDVGLVQLYRWTPWRCDDAAPPRAC